MNLAKLQLKEIDDQRTSPSLSNNLIKIASLIKKKANVRSSKWIYYFLWGNRNLRFFFKLTTSQTFRLYTKKFIVWFHSPFLTQAGNLKRNVYCVLYTIYYARKNLILLNGKVKRSELFLLFVIWSSTDIFTQCINLLMPNYYN